MLAVIFNYYYYACCQAIPLSTELIRDLRNPSQHKVLVSRSDYMNKEKKKRHSKSASFYRALKENKIKDAKEPRTVENEA